MYTREVILETFKEFFRFTTGNGGSKLLNSSYSEKDTFKVIMFTEETVISYVDQLSNETFTNLTVPAGFQIYGNLINVNITSGVAIGYLD